MIFMSKYLKKNIKDYKISINDELKKDAEEFLIKWEGYNPFKLIGLLIHMINSIMTISEFTDDDLEYFRNNLRKYEGKTDVGDYQRKS